MLCGDDLFLAELHGEPAQARLPNDFVERKACVALFQVGE
jgi:hypothetical protein